MRILDRHICRPIISTFLGCLSLFFFLYVIIDIFSKLEDILKMKVGLDILLSYYLASLPTIFIQVAPVASLLAVLFSLSKLNHNNEIIAMRSSGLSVFQISKSVVIFGIMVSMLVFFVNDKLVPRAVAATEKLKLYIDPDKDKLRKLEDKDDLFNISMYGLKNRLYFVTRFSPSTNSMEGITILEHDQSQNIVEKIIAPRAAYRDDMWIFYDSITYDFDKNGQVVAEPQYLQERAMAIPETPRDFVHQKQQSELMSLAQLDEYIWKLSKSGATGIIRSLKVDFYNRLASPFTNLSIILLGIPFALKIKKRSGGFASVGLSIVMGFFYYVLNAVSIALGKAGIIAPLLSATLSHIVTIAIALFLLLRLP